MYKILVIEDEVKTLKTITKGLSEHGYMVDFAIDGHEGLLLTDKNHYDLIITDILMPKLNGIDFCLQIREKKLELPILILSALGLTDEKLKGFKAGADDYLVKPFDFNELLARVNAILKRSGEYKLPQEILEYSRIKINCFTREAFIDNNSLLLTAKEFVLLEYFMKNKETLLSKERIIEHVWGLNFDTGTNILEVYISYLRNKIDQGNANKLIHTRKGLGYIFHMNIDYANTD